MTSIPELTPVSHYDNAWDSSRLSSKDGWILDPQNRVVILHGINLSGGTKMPFYYSSENPNSAVANNTESIGPLSSKKPSSTLSSPQQNSSNHNNINNVQDHGEIPGVVYSYTEENFYKHRDVSFVNRPFPLDKADIHFERLARWGCQCLRILVPWEALEHSGPGIYDEDYIDYLIKLLKVAAKYGLKCFLDPHVDCWSRFTGGSGMPGWTLELAGLDMTKFGQTGAAVIHNTYKDKQNYPKMIWATNSIKLGAATMYSLFFAGQIFAPKAMVPLSATVLSHFQKVNSTIVSDEAYRRGVPGGIKAPSPVQNLIPIPRTDQYFIDRGMVNIQHFLQCHFIETFVHLTQRILQDDIQSKKEGNPGLIDGGTVMGFDTLNEPSPGYLNHPDLNKLLEMADLQVGTCPTPFQGMQLAQGETVKCQVWETGGLGPMNKGSVKVNEEKVNLWNRPYWNPQKFNDKSGSSSIESIVSHLKLSASKAFNSGNLQTTTHNVEINGKTPSESGWREPQGYNTSCLWAEHGVWDPKTGKLLKPNYFEKIPASDYAIQGLHPGKEVEWKQDFWLPFVNTLSLRLRQQDPGLTMFVEPPINEAPPVFRLDKALIRGAEDNIIHLFQAISRWKILESFKSQPDSPNNDQNNTQPQNEDDGDNIDGHKSIGKPKNRSISTSSNDDGCQHVIFDPLGDVGQNVVVAPHFYDGYSNITRDFIPFTLDYLGFKRKLYWSVLGALKFGWTNVEKTWAEQVKGISSDIRVAMGDDHGILMGETGLPMDMHSKASYQKNYGNPKQSFAMRLLLDAMDESMMSFTLWNYCADNSNYWGDRWNGEDFSVWCELENGFSRPNFKTVSSQQINLEGVSSTVGQISINVMRQNVTLTEIAADLASAKEEAGCQEGFLWWLCLPKSNVWTSRAAPKKLVVISVEPVSPSSSGQNLAGSETNLISTAQKAQPIIKDTLTSWQDLLPLSLQIERSRLEFYGGLRVAESFVRAYPLAVWGIPILYQFEPGKPISDKNLVSKDIGKKKTKDVNSWENRFYLLYSLACTRRSRRDSHTSDHIHSQDEIQGCGDDYDIHEPPPTDIFLPRFHFSLDSPIGVDQFESLNYIQELEDDLRQQHQDITTVQKSPSDKGRWHRLEIQVSDGNHSIQPDRQVLQYWSSPIEAIEFHNSPESKTKFYDQVEDRIQNLFSLGWNGSDGITTASERDWIKRLWKEMRRGKAEIESLDSTSALSCLWPFSSKRPSGEDLELSKKLKKKEIQQKWRNLVGLPDKIASRCVRCGHLEVMHLHAISAKLQVWSGVRG